MPDKNHPSQKNKATTQTQQQQPQQVQSSSNKSELHIKIDNTWYDLTQWQHVHPGGSTIMEYLNEQDATDAFYSLHSKEAVERLARIPKSKQQVRELDSHTTPKEVVAFRKFRKQLEDEGFFNRDAKWEFFYLSIIYGLCVLGTYLSFKQYTITSILCLGLAMLQAGWVGHDFIHGRGTYCHWNGNLMAGIVNGFSRSWWSDKHNTHHVYTNYTGIDRDISNEPTFYLYFPNIEHDSPFRCWQHIYYLPAYSFLWASWRLQSFIHVIKNCVWSEMPFIALGTIWVLCLPVKVAIGSILLSGFLGAVIVTATHQSEEMYTADRQKEDYNYIKCQFETTRDAACNNMFIDFLWGGMQYQLEHHIFPTMPKYYYSTIAPRLAAFAKQNNLSYRIDNITDILTRNYETYKFYSANVGSDQNKQIHKQRIHTPSGLPAVFESDYVKSKSE